MSVVSSSVWVSNVCVEHWVFSQPFIICLSLNLNLFWRWKVSLDQAAIKCLVKWWEWARDWWVRAWWRAGCEEKLWDTLVLPSVSVGAPLSCSGENTAPRHLLSSASDSVSRLFILWSLGSQQYVEQSLTVHSSMIQRYFNGVWFHHACKCLQMNQVVLLDFLSWSWTLFQQFQQNCFNWQMLMLGWNTNWSDGVFIWAKVMRSNDTLSSSLWTMKPVDQFLCALDILVSDWNISDRITCCSLCLFIKEWQWMVTMISGYHPGLAEMTPVSPLLQLSIDDNNHKTNISFIKISFHFTSW